MLVKITDKLNQDERLSGWQVREARRKSSQLFLNRERIESRREVESLVYEVEVLVNHTRPVAGRKKSAEKLTGSSRFVTDRLSLARLDQDIDQAVFAAEMVDNQPYHLTDPGPIVPNPGLFDPVLAQGAGGAVRELADRLKQAVAREEGVRLSAAEFFADRTFVRHINSQGFQAAQEASLVSSEMVLLTGAGGAETEVFRAFKRRRVEDLAVEAEIKDASELGRRRLSAGLPSTGTFDVVFSGEALDHLFDWFVTQSSGAAKYNRLVSNQPEQVLVEAKAGASGLTLYHNAEIPWAVGSYRFDSSGLPACRRKLFHRGTLVGYWSADRWAQYLGLNATGDFGNIEVEPGNFAPPDLLKPGADRPLYHLFEFSCFEPNSLTGEFSAEIRAGEEITARGSRPVKGGSVSGSSRGAMAGARFSSEIARREKYMGPAYVHCENLTLAGG